MKTQHHTKEECFLSHSINGTNVTINRNGGEVYIFRCYDLDDPEETEGNGELIEESFNVTNECGLTPRQLLEQRNNLLEALNKLRDLVDNGYLIRDISRDDDYQYFLKQGIAITKALTLTNEAIKKATE